jgi:hypothetical protein
MMWSFIARHWRGEISFRKSFPLVFIPGAGLLAAVDGVLEVAHNLGAIPKGLVWLFDGLYIPVFVWLVTGTWRSARRALNSGGPRSASIQRRYNRRAIFIAAGWLVAGMIITATLIFPVRDRESAVAIAVGTAFGLGVTALGGLASLSIIRVIGKLVAAGEQD